jgi:hypothetical protein
MKKLLILVAFAGLLAACHRNEYQGGPGTESGTYQGTTGSEGWQGNTNGHSPSIPKTGAGGMGGQTEPGPSGMGSEQHTNHIEQLQPDDDENYQYDEYDSGFDDEFDNPDYDSVE